MKKAMVVIGFAFFALPALCAADQHERKKACNAEASKQELKGNTRKAFMKQCLSANAETPAQSPAAAEPDANADAKEEKVLTPQQQKMKTCNKEAKAKMLRGAERKAFLSECLKSKPGAAEQ
jgi:psiF repeat